MSFFSELKRRNVFKVASVYLVTSWIILQVVAVISPALHLPTLFSTIFTVVLVMGFPVACIFAWAFELTPDGLKYSHEVDETESIRHHTGTKINYFLAIALLFALSFISYEKWFVASANDNLERSIAVLPFEDMSSDKSQGYFGDGISEEILNSLARLNQLVVIARTSSFNFKGSKTDIREIGRILDVNYVLEGSVRKDKDQLRITAQLIEVESGKHIWSQTYDRELTSIFALQDELTFAITRALKLNLLPEHIEHEAGMTTNPQAYELFIKGRALAYQRTDDSLQKAAEVLNTAIELDNKFYLAKAQLFMIYKLSADYGGFTVEQQETEKERLFWELMIAPDFPLKNLVIAEYTRLNNKLGHSEISKLYAKAYQQAPNDPLIQNLYTLYLNDIEKSIEIRTQILKTNPESQVNYSNLLHLYLTLGRVQEAENVLSIINTKFPDTLLTFRANIYWFYGYNQNINDTLTYLKSYQGEQTLEFKRFNISLSLLYGSIDEAIEQLSETLIQSPENLDFLYNSILLLYDFKEKNILNTQQSQKLQQLVVTKKFSTELSDWHALLKGNPHPYMKSNGISESSPDNFLDKVDIFRMEPYLFAAILKQQGNSQFADTLISSSQDWLQWCQKENAIPHWSCVLIIYLAGENTPEQTFDIFQRSLKTLDSENLGVERFIFTSPIYYGVNQHPEFEKAANDLLDRTFRKWQHHIASNEALFKRDFKN
ncbi:hypothetical protein [Shewanella gaetbuli]